LELIEQWDIDPNEALSKSEINLQKVNEVLSIPNHISNLHLRQLLHKQSMKVNKWAKQSLRGKTHLDFAYFMENDKSFIDKNSL
jgi:hypothetical protein